MTATLKLGESLDLQATGRLAAQLAACRGAGRDRPGAGASGPVGLLHGGDGRAGPGAEDPYNAATQRLGFILVTGRADGALMAEGQRLGMNTLIKKPFTPQAPKGCIERVVGRL